MNSGLISRCARSPAAVAGFDDNAPLRASGIMLAGKKFMYLRNDEEMMCGKAGQGGVTIFKTGQALILGTYNQDMAASMNCKEVSQPRESLLPQWPLRRSTAFLGLAHPARASEVS